MHNNITKNPSKGHFWVIKSLVSYRRTPSLGKVNWGRILIQRHWWLTVFCLVPGSGRLLKFLLWLLMCFNMCQGITLWSWSSFSTFHGTWPPDLLGGQGACLALRAMSPALESGVPDSVMLVYFDSWPHTSSSSVSWILSVTITSLSVWERVLVKRYFIHLHISGPEEEHVL